MKFTEIDHGFCESVGEILPYPEIFNSYSSMAMSVFGLIGLLLTLRYKRVHDIRFICGLLVVNGVGSFYYHYTQQIGWALIDELSMMLAVALGLNSMYTMIINSLHLPVSQNVYSYRAIHNHITYKGLLTLALSFYVILIYPMSIFDETREWFPMIFTIPMMCLIPGCVYIYFVHYRNSYVYKPNNKSYENNGGDLLLNGLKWALFASTVWGFTEPLCQTYQFMKYFHTHVIWHVFISYGMFLLIMFLLHFHLYTIDKRHYKINYIGNIIPVFHHKTA
jgi:hypothetical protein